MTTATSSGGPAGRWDRRHRTLAGLYLAVVAGAGVWSIVTGRLAGEVSLLPCPVHWLTGIACPGCGITRASVALARGDFARAWHFHPFVYLLVPLALSFLIAPRWTRATWTAIPAWTRQAATTLALLACLALWILR